MKYPKYFKIQLIVHRISAMFHLFFAPIDFPHHRLISRKTHPGSWLFTSFHPNVARSIPSFKQIVHFLDFARLHPPSPPLLVKKKTCRKIGSVYCSEKAVEKCPLFSCPGIFFHISVVFLFTLIRFIEMQLLAVFCNVPWNQPPSHSIVKRCSIK